jgi:hypothetical protein
MYFSCQNCNIFPHDSVGARVMASWSLNNAFVAQPTVQINYSICLCALIVGFLGFFLMKQEGFLVGLRSITKEGPD